MIARSPQPVGTPDWQAALRAAYRDPRALLAYLGLAPADLDLDLESPFPFRVTREFAARMRPGDPNDPLLRQVLPLAAERAMVAGFVADPLAEQAEFADGPLLRKYAGRALLVTTGACAIHCRYCFRREFPYAEAAGNARLAAALASLTADASVSEVLLSGGDPLSLDDAALAALLARLHDIPHLRRLRIHTRLPVVLPARVTPQLCQLLATSRFAIALVLHVNHAHEVDDGVRDACRALRAAGATLLNQSVLLRGVNDDVDSLATLSETLFAAGVLPYYVHALDAVRGAAHFDAGDARGRVLEDALRARLPGYLVPRFVREMPGAEAKLPLNMLALAPRDH